MEAPKLEGITPDMLWTFLVVLAALAALYLLFDKVRTSIRTEQQRKADQQELKGKDITDRIADKVMAKLQEELDKKFDEIDTRLQRDRQDIDRHTTQLSAIESRVERLDESSRALCHGVFALLGHSVDGNSVEKLQKTHNAMKNYLIDGKYKEEEWT